MPCEAVAENREVGTDIKTKCTGKVKQGDLLLKKTGDYLLEDRPALHFHCAKRAFDIEVWLLFCIMHVASSVCLLLLLLMRSI